MKKSCLILLLIAAAGFAVPAFADCDGKRSALSDFGTAALGDSPTKLPRDVTRLPDCEICNNRYADCELLDKSGVSYVVLGDVITRKNIRIERNARGTRRLSFDLVPADRIAQVVRKISARSDAPDLYILHRGGRFELFSGLCLSNERGANFALEFTFGDDEKLQQMSVLVDSPGN